MNKFVLWLNLLSLFIAHSASAYDCTPQVEHYLPELNLQAPILEVANNSHFCFDESAIKDSVAISKFNYLKNKGVFVDNCLIEKKYDAETSQLITDLILQTTKSSLKIYSLDSEQTSKDSLILMTNSEDKDFLKKAFKNSMSNSKLDLTIDPESLTTKDTIAIGAAAVSSSLIGIAIQRNMAAFKNPDGTLQEDKKGHAIAGAIINLGGVAGSYLIIESAGLGSKLGLTKNQKKWAILLTGTILGMAIGYGKERFIDYRHQDVHTYDPKLKGDMGATWLGGGILNPIMGAISFQF